jgi:hypothetical protein
LQHDPANRAVLVKLIAETIYRHANGDPNELAERIVAEIEAAGYETTKPELIPVRRNPKPLKSEKNRRTERGGFAPVPQAASSTAPARRTLTGAIDRRAALPPWLCRLAANPPKGSLRGCIVH